MQEDEHQYPDCPRAFRTTRGLGVNRQMIHRAEYDQEVRASVIPSMVRRSIEEVRQIRLRTYNIK